MTPDFAVRQAVTSDPPRQSPRAAGPDRVPGSTPAPPMPELGPPNPRMRMDRDLGMVVIEFRDTTGQVSVSLPTPRELEAYRAAVMYGSSLPSDMAPNNEKAESLMKSRPGLPPLEAAPSGPLGRLPNAAPEKERVDRVT